MRNNQMKQFKLSKDMTQGELLKKFKESVEFLIMLAPAGRKFTLRNQVDRFKFN